MIELVQPETISMTLYRIPIPKQGDRTRQVNMKSGKSFIGHYQPKKITNEKDALILLAQEYRPEHIWTEPIEVQVTFFFPWTKSITKKRKLSWSESGLDYKSTKPDLDNLEKMLFDALEGVIYQNDSQIVSKFSEKRLSDTPRIQIVLTKIERI